MGTEIKRVSAIGGGRFRFEVECESLGHAAACMNRVVEVEPAAFAPVEPTAASYYADAAARLHIAAQREAKREAAQQATGRRIPTAHMPPFVADLTTLGGNAYPPEEPEALTAGTAYAAGGFLTADECKPGGTSVD
jgi:hypothetical protein